MWNVENSLRLKYIYLVADLLNYSISAILPFKGYICMAKTKFYPEHLLSSHFNGGLKSYCSKLRHSLRCDPNTKWDNIQATDTFSVPWEDIYS